MLSLVLAAGVALGAAAKPPVEADFVLVPCSRPSLDVLDSVWRRIEL